VGPQRASVCSESASAFQRSAHIPHQRGFLSRIPDPLRCPEGESRKSLALYYYTVEDGTEIKARSTNYRSRLLTDF